MTIKPSFSGEVQFRRYSDTSSQGQQIVLAVADREALAPFIGKEGKRFMAVFVEIGDDEQPVQTPEPVRVGPLCREAVGLCQMPEFQRWAPEHTNSKQGDVFNEDACRQFILRVCQIKSRKELDTLRYASDLFRTEIRVPFMKHMKERKAA